MKKLSRSGFIVLASVLAVFMLLAAYPANAEEKPQYGGILRNLEPTGPGSPFGTPWESVGGSSLAMKPCLENMLREETNGKLHPWAATAWEFPPDKSYVTFTLRKGVKFHDGSDLNAEVVRWNLQTRKDAKKSATRKWTKIEVLDDYHVRVHLSDYQNTVLSGFTGGGGYISKKSFDEKGLEWARYHPIGTGPFKFTSFKRDVVSKYVRNENYWNKGRPYLDGIELHYIRDNMTLRAAFEAGEGEVMGLDLGKPAAELKAKGFKMLSASSGVVVLMPDSTNPDSPFADKRVREALGYAIDREAIVKAKGFGFWHPSYQLPPVGTIAYDSNFKGRRYDPEKAKNLLAEAGFPNGFQTKIIPMPGPVDRDVMVLLQAYFAAVGIQVKLDFVPYSKFSEYRMKGWHNAILCQPYGLFPNFNQTLQWYLSPESTQFPSLKRPDGLGKLINASLSSLEPERDKMIPVVRKIFEEAMVIPIHDIGRAYATQQYVHDVDHMAWGAWTNWRPDKAWMSKK
ncbi:ABC transporter substrate-binding protein [Thermodesulfobacteriota bacterium]